MTFLLSHLCDKVLGSKKVVKRRMKVDAVTTALLLLAAFLAIISDGKVMLPQGPHQAVEGKRSRIDCSVTEETFTGWFTDGRLIPTDKSKRVHVEGQGNYYYLVMNPANRTDRGRYECRGNKERAFISVTVYYKPTVRLSETTTRTIYSPLKGTERLKIKCAFDGDPVPNVTMRRPGNNKEVASGSGSVSYEFSTISLDDFGFYTCEGKNVAGEASHSIEVYRTGPPEPPSKVEVIPNCDRVDLTWDTPLNNRGSDVTGYRIEILQEGSIVESKSYGVSTTSRTFNGLERSSSYVVRLNAKNSMGSGSWRTIPFNTTEICSSAQAVTASSLVLAVLSSMVIFC